MKPVGRANQEGYAHSHDFYAILWFEEGEGTHQIDFDSYDILPERFHFFAPGKVHSMQASSPIEGQALIFTESFLADADSAEPLWFRYPFFSFYDKAEFVPRPEQSEQCRALIADMRAEYESPFPDRHTAIKHLLRLLLLHINRGYASEQTRTADRKVYRYFREFIMLLNENFQRERRVGFYARRLGISAAHLTSCTRAVSGSSASRLIQDRVLLEVKRQLRHSDLPVHKIAGALNFEDAGYLTRFFKKLTGTTPREFRSEMF